MARAVVLPAICAAVAWGIGFASMMAIFLANTTSDRDLDQNYIPHFAQLLELGLIVIGGFGCSVAYRLTTRGAHVMKIVLFGASFAMAFLALTLVIGEFRPALDADAGNALELGAFAAVAGFIVAWVFQRMERSLKVKDLLLIACFWAVSWTVAWPVLLKVVTSLNNYGLDLAWIRSPWVALPHTDVDRLSWCPARYAWGLDRGLYPSLFVWGAFLGASCSGIMFWCLHRPRRGASASARALRVGS
jgi:hypothetical protein